MPGLDQIEDAEKLAEAIQLRLSTGEEANTRSLRYFHEFAVARERWQDRAQDSAECPEVARLRNARRT